MVRSQAARPGAETGHRRRAAGALAGVFVLMLAGSAGYTVRPGDTLLDISIRTGVKVADLRALNDIPDPDLIIAGRTLSLGGAAAGEARDAPSGGAGGDDVGAQPAVGGRGEVAALIERTASTYGMSPAFVKAVAWQESGFNQLVTSHASAVGIMQVLPSTGRFVSQNLVGRSLDLHQPADNVEAGVAFLRYLYRATGGDVRMTLAGYYQGLRSVREHGVYQDTERYVANVLALRDRMR